MQPSGTGVTDYLSYHHRSHVAASKWHIQRQSRYICINIIEVRMVSNDVSCIDNAPFPLYAFTAWCSVKHRDNFTFFTFKPPDYTNSVMDRQTDNVH
jgi:hypothetical protein